MSRFDIALDTAKQQIVPQVIKARILDSESCIIVAAVTENGTPYSFTGKSVRFECTKPDGGVISDTDVSISGSTITYHLPKVLLTTDGAIRCAYFRIYDDVVFADSTESFVIDILPGNSGKLPHCYITELDAALAATKQQNSVMAAAEAERERNERIRITNEDERITHEDIRCRAEAERERRELLRQMNESNRLRTYRIVLRELEEARAEHSRIIQAIDALGALHDEHDYMLLVRGLHLSSRVAEWRDGELVITDESGTWSSDGAFETTKTLYGLEV